VRLTADAGIAVRVAVVDELSVRGRRDSERHGCGEGDQRAGNNNVEDPLHVRSFGSAIGSGAIAVARLWSADLKAGSRPAQIPGKRSLDAAGERRTFLDGHV